jgi:hypothetical protein
MRKVNCQAHQQKPEIPTQELIEVMKAELSNATVVDDIEGLLLLNAHSIS